MPRQTQSYLRQLLQSRGIQPKNKLGQNFLTDLNLLDLVVTTAELAKDDLILEIGAGTGGLTARLADAAGAVVAVEIDPAMADLAGEHVGDRPNVHLIRGDALRTKNELNPAIGPALDAAAAQFSVTRLKLVANLPYAVATPVIANLIQGDRPIERMVVMVQWEIAERLTAEVGSPNYAALAVLMKTLSNVEIVRRLPPAAFWPRPRVDSAIVLIRPDAEKRARVGDVAAFRRFLRDLYVHRRKNLRGALAGWPDGRRDKAEIDRLLGDHGFDGAGRAEQLNDEQHLRLWRAWVGG